MPLTQRDDALAIAQGVIHLVQRHHHGDAVVEVDVAQGFHHDASRFRVQRGDGFIGKNDLRFLHQGSGDSHALLLSTGQGGDALVGEMRHSDAGQRLQRFLLLRGGEPAQTGAPERGAADRANQHVLQYRQAIDQVELLEDIARLGAAFADIPRQASCTLHGVAQQLDVAF